MKLMKKLGEIGGKIGEGAIDKLSGGLMSRAGNWIGNKIFGGSEDERMRDQQKMLQDLQIEGNQKMLDQLMAKEKAMLRDGFAEQVAGLEKAGLSKSMMMGGGGAGGMTGGSAGAPSTAVAENPTDKLMASAQLELMKAQTEKTRAEAGKIGGVDTQLGETQIANLTQGIENQKAVQRLTVVQEELNELQLAINESTFNDVINNVHFIAQQNYQAMKIVGYDEKVQGATIEQKIKLVNQELTNAVLTSASIQQGITKSKAEVNKMSEDIAQAWKNLEQRGQEINIKQFSEEIKANYPSVINVLGKEIDDGIQSFYNIFRNNRSFYKGVK